MGERETRSEACSQSGQHGYIITAEQSWGSTHTHLWTLLFPPARSLALGPAARPGSEPDLPDPQGPPLPPLRWGVPPPITAGFPTPVSCSCFLTKCQKKAKDPKQIHVHIRTYTYKRNPVNNHLKQSGRSKDFVFVHPLSGFSRVSTARCASFWFLCCKMRFYGCQQFHIIKDGQKNRVRVSVAHLARFFSSVKSVFKKIKHWFYSAIFPSRFSWSKYSKYSSLWCSFSLQVFNPRDRK